MNNGHEYVTEDHISLADNKYGFKSYKVERCEKCRNLRVKFENKNGEWEVFNAVNEPLCKETPK